jgi:hypothetical protein
MSSTTPEVNLTPAEKYYKNHLKNVSNYQKRNPEKMREKNKKHNDKLKIEDPEKYKARLEKSRNYYQTVVKPKILASKQANEELIIQ